MELVPGEVVPPPGRQPEVRPAATSASDRADGRRRYEVTIDGWVLSVGLEAAARAALRERAAKPAAVTGPPAGP